ncbi:MAG: ribokinase [Thermomicrobiales bacterium]|nr:ribokinase [Thermomicrobiales bacterium]
MGTVVVIGSSNTDLVSSAERLPRAGETVRGDAFATYPGGKGANQAVAARRASANVRFVGATGDDDFGKARRQELRDEGIDVTYLAEHQGATSGVAQIIVDAHGENQIVVVPGANDLVDPASVIKALESDCSVISMVLEISFDAVLAALNAEHSATKVVNAAPFDSRIMAHLDQVDVLICNESEAAAVLGRPFDVRDETATKRAAEDLIGHGPTAAIITIGAGGAVVAHADGTQLIRAPKAKVVDTTGAGDCFCGVFAAWLASGASLREATAAGVVAGSLSVSIAGAQPSMPNRAAIESAMSDQPLA